MASLRFLLGMLPGTAKFESDSDNLRKDYFEFKKFESSEELKNFESLEREVDTSDFKHKIKNLKSLKYKGSKEYDLEKEYRKLLKSKPFRKYQKLTALNPTDGTPENQQLNILETSPEIKRVKELEVIISSEKFIEAKKYLSLSFEDKFQISDEYKKQMEYNNLKNSEKILWYKRIKRKYPFNEIEKWDMVFEDKFDTGKLDEKTWMNKYFNGDSILKKGYVLADDKHSFTEGKNLEIFDKKLRIITRREKSKCFVWNPVLGFYEKEFDFTSDLISSAKGFKSKYGIFEAKVRIANSGVTQAFSLMTDQILPHIDIFRFEKGKMYAGNFWMNGKGMNKTISSTGGSKFFKDFFIYSLEWQPGKLIWRVNGIVFKEQTTGLPEKEMYMVFNASLKEKAKEIGIPSSLEIDWVRVYTRKQ